MANFKKSATDDRIFERSVAQDSRNSGPAKPSLTGADAATHKLKHDILRGALAPDEKLRVRALTARYGIGASPMREALARLSGGGLVRLEGQKGFRVTSLNSTDLRDITHTRQLVESEALALAVETAGDLWEADILKAFHLLTREVERRAGGSPAWLDAFEFRHHGFHMALISACPLQSLKTFCDDLYLRAERYRRIMFGYSFETRDVVAEHRNLMDSTLSGDVAVAKKKPHRAHWINRRYSSGVVSGRVGKKS